MRNQKTSRVFKHWNVLSFVSTKSQHFTYTDEILTATGMAFGRAWLAVAKVAVLPPLVLVGLVGFENRLYSVRGGLIS